MWVGQASCARIPMQRSPEVSHGGEQPLVSQIASTASCPPQSPNSVRSASASGGLPVSMWVAMPGLPSGFRRMAAPYAMSVGSVV